MPIISFLELPDKSFFKQLVGAYSETHIFMPLIYFCVFYFPTQNLRNITVIIFDER